ncbi:MAG: TonB-dependent receptor, partial [Saprospiraceae bacterium]|nr:TonB-dependent receptor [Pyrinomonadaceae bacterium]
MKLAKVLVLVCLLAAGVSAQRTGTLTGNVQETIHVQPNSSTKLYVSGATVTLISKKDENVKFTAVTDGAGNFRFENIPEGEYSLFGSRIVEKGETASRIEAKENVSLKEGKQIIKNLLLLVYIDIACGTRNCGQVRETVTVSADQRQPLDEVSKTVNVIDGQEMRDRADFSLVESLRTIPGFRVQQLGGFGRTASIKSRGLRNQDTAILIDGVRFRDASSITGDASAFLSDLTLTSVSRIEVLRGPGSSLYGTNAIGGAVDFQTPAPQAGWHGQVSANAGGLGLSRFRGNVSNGLSNGKFGFNLALARTDYREGIDKEDDADNTNFQSRIEAKPFEKTNISARFFVSDAFVRLNSNPDTFGNLPISNSAIIVANPGVNFAFDANDPDSNQKSKFFNGQVVVTQVISDRLYFQGYYSGLKTERRNTNGLLGIPFQSESTSIFDGSIHTANGHIDWTP